MKKENKDCQKDKLIAKLTEEMLTLRGLILQNKLSGDGKIYDLFVEYLAMEEKTGTSPEPPGPPN